MGSILKSFIWKNRFLSIKNFGIFWNFPGYDKILLTVGSVRGASRKRDAIRRRRENKTDQMVDASRKVDPISITAVENIFFNKFFFSSNAYVDKNIDHCLKNKKKMGSLF